MGYNNDSTGQVSINTKGVAQNTYDAIVIGSGISGGWAAKELCKKGLKTLVLERGRNVEHIKDYTTATTDLWDFKHHNIMLSKQTLDDNPIVSRCYAFTEATEHFFVKDKAHPYVQDKPFNWIRGYQVGGKSLIWGRWTQRWSDLDFEANAKDGHGVDWPIRYNDIAPWYSHVEKFVGISGNKDGIPHLPDGEFLPPMELNALEKHLQNSIKQNYTDRQLITSRTANLTQAINGRSPCQYRDMCARGCPYGAYFSSNSSTLPAAKATGNLTLQPFAVVHSIIYDEAKGKATGVRVIDAKTKEETEYFAKIIFINGGTLNTTLLLLNSTSSRFPNGFGNDNGVLGHYLMDHNYSGKIEGRYTGLQNSYYYGRKPTGVYIPRFRNVGKNKRTDFIRGYAIAGGGSRATGLSDNNNPLGAAFKEGLSEAGDW
ncbi:MAG: GMC family oxidoreductase, partial [Bacteroidota bacterium]|nr:GMC family oxidoreductase [Bacteroidota bacterium]